MTPQFATVNILALILAGGFWSLYADDIKGAWPFNYRARYHICWPAFWSWLLALFAAIGFLIRQKADDQERRRINRRQFQAVRQLENLIRTLPPAKFVDSFANLQELCEETTHKVLAAPPYDPQQIEGAIRVVLNSIATLAKIFDGDSDKDTYAANIMIFREATAINDADKATMQQHLRFAEAGVTIDGLRGVLELKLPLSCTTGTDLAADTTLGPLALPVPLPENEKGLNGKWKVLPGAPLAFVTGIPDIHPDFIKMKEWCHNFGEYSPTVMAALDDYMTTHDEHMLGFLSVPLQNGEIAVAVLNVHCDRKGMLHDYKESVTQFVSIIRPLQKLLVQLMRAQSPQGSIL